MNTENTGRKNPKVMLIDDNVGEVIIAKAALKEARFTYAVPKYLHQKSCENLIAKMLPR